MTRASITSARDFRRAYRSGTKARVDAVTVWVAVRGDQEQARLGMAIRATVGTAVERNRLRRRVREIFRAYNPAPGADVVVAATKEANGRNFQDLESVVTQAFERAGCKR